MHARTFCVDRRSCTWALPETTFTPSEGYTWETKQDPWTMRGETDYEDDWTGTSAGAWEALGGRPTWYHEFYFSRFELQIFLSNGETELGIYETSNGEFRPSLSNTHRRQPTPTRVNSTAESRWHRRCVWGITDLRNCCRDRRGDPLDEGQPSGLHRKRHRFESKWEGGGWQWSDAIYL